MKETKLKGCVVVQGPTNGLYVELLKTKFEGYQLIFSTWEDAEKSAYEKGDIVLYNEYPIKPGFSNLNYQKVSTLNGIQKAKELGWKRVLKWRSDMFPTDADALFQSFDTTKLNGLAWVVNQGGYITDYFFEGDVKDIETLYDVEMTNDFPEKNLTRQFYLKGLNTNVNWIISSLTNNNDIWWEHRDGGFYLSTYQTNSVYSTKHVTQWQ